MSVTNHVGLVSACLAATVAFGQVSPAIAVADEAEQQQHNVTYRARVDGVSRGLTITYNISDTEVETATPTVLPGQTFEANAVLADPQKAGMEISIRWPYTANLYCEILVDDAVVAQAEDFIAPRFLPQSSDPGYGVMPCGSELANAAAINAANTPSARTPAGPAPSVLDTPPT